MANVLVTGGAGFIGSHLCQALVGEGHRVYVLDNLSSGRTENLDALSEEPLFFLYKGDVCEEITMGVRFDLIYHLACPASPKDYFAHPIETLRAGAQGTWNVAQLAEQHRARLVVASTSEVYGDPLQVPQREEYWGNVNPIGRRAPYDEAKRYAEALCTSFTHVYGSDIRIARIFNTYGPRLRSDDGRVISNFVCQALAGEPLTVYGDGSQTRSFLYIDDLVKALLALSEVQERPPGPINLGNPQETPVLELALLVLKLTGSISKVVHRELPADDPRRRLPAIERARRYLAWEPRIALQEGLEKTIAYFRDNCA